MNDYIYVVHHKYAYHFNNIKCQKIGSTRNPIARLSTYFTYYITRPYFYRLYKVDFNCYDLDNLIKDKFKEYNIRDEPNSGIEFYDQKLTFELLEQYFKDLNIDFASVDLSLIEKNIVNHPTVDDYKYIFEEEQLSQKLNDNKINPRDYQVEIITKAIKYFLTNEYGKIILPCGVGKSLCAYWIATKLNCDKILILVPTLPLLTQLGKTFIKQLKQDNLKIKRRFIGSDLAIDDEIIYTQNDSDKIKKFITSNQKFIIFSTYQSCMALDAYKFDFIICDEAHHTAVPSTDSYFSNFVVKHKKSKKLFLTATEKIIQINNTKDDDNLNTMSMDDIDLYGNVIHWMSIPKAIELKCISNYKIIVHKKDIDSIIDSDTVDDLEKKYGKFKNIAEYYCKAYIINEVMQKYKIKRIITKHSRMDNAKIFCQLLKDVAELENVSYLDGNDSVKFREDTIKEFSNSDNAVICQMKVLNEGVDIPPCDCCIPIDNIESSIDIVQFMMRCMRLHNDKTMAYFVLPMLVSSKSDIINNKKEFNNIRIILRAMSYEDERILAYFKDFKFNKDDERKQIDEIDEVDEFINFDRFDDDIHIQTNIVTDINTLSPETFEKAKKYVIDKKFNTVKEYRNWCLSKKDHFNIPKNPDVIYKTLGWIDWSDWLGVKVLDIERIRKLVSKENEKRRLLNNKLIETKEGYDIWAQENDYSMSNELEEFHGMIDWGWFLNVDKYDQYLSWIECVKICRELYKDHEEEYLLLSDCYHTAQSLHNIPEDPIYYKEFESFDTLFEIKKNKKK